MRTPESRRGHVRLSISPYVHLSVCPSVHLSACLSVHLSVCSSVHLSICPSVRLTTAEISKLGEMSDQIQALLGFQGSSRIHDY